MPFQRFVVLSLAVIAAGCSRPATETLQSSPETADAANESSLRIVNGWFIVDHVDAANLQGVIAQVRDRDVSRLRVSFPLPYRDVESHREVLRLIGDSCSQLQGLELHEFSLSSSDLVSVLSKLSKLQELRLDQCVVNPGNSPWSDLSTPLQVLSVRYCEGMSDEQIGRLLGVCPDLRELFVCTPSFQGEPLTGEGWPLKELRQLRSFSTYGASDALIRRVVSTAPALTSLDLNHNDQLTGEGWQFQNGDRFEELHLSHCKALTDESLGRIVEQLPQLTSLSLTGYGVATGATIEPTSLRSLTSLRLAGPKLDFDFVAQAVRNATELEELDLRSVYPQKDIPIEFGHLKRLRNLSVEGGTVPVDFPATLSGTIEHLHIGHCSVSNSSIAEMLPRMKNLETLDLYWLSGPSGGESHPEAVTGEGWDFSSLTKLRELDLSKSRFLNNDLVPRLSQQVPELEKLSLSENQRLTGDDWDLDGFRQLREISLTQLPKLKDDAVNRLPSSLRRLKIERCPQLIGQVWRLASFPNLETVQIKDCSELVSVGRELPLSLRELSAVECDKLQCSDLDYRSLKECRSINFRDCRSLDVNRLFLNIAKGCEQLKILDLSGCPDVTVQDWDVRDLAETLESFRYFEGDPSYFGGASEKTSQFLTRQLAGRFECDHTR